MKKIVLSLLFLTAGLGVQAQLQTPQPSPSAKMEQVVGLTDVSVTYSRPSLRGRKAIGDLVPFDKLWRTGANSNTVVSFSDAVSIDGKELPAGSYALYTKPGKSQWEVYFYKTTDNWGLPSEWNDSNVALKFMAEAQPLPFKMETFTIIIDELTNDSALFNIVWEETVVNFTVAVPTKAKAMKNIEAAMQKDPSANDYYQAASYYHDAGLDLKKAHMWITKATDGRADAFWYWRKKSLIEADLKDTKAAIASAKKSLELAEKAGNADYVKMNKDALKEWGAL
ncbi:MAG: DUF2911 domain-containing protein [Flavobacteriaceae bacterium]|nr:DUF2911 domain-containing protein [Flavobacteriaceae bacterium]